MLEFVYYSAAILFASLAAYFDLKTRVIPKEVSLGLLGFALSLHFLESGITGNIQPLLDSVIAMVVSYVVLYLAWALGVISGGDAKLLVGLNAMLVRIKTFPFINSYYLAFLPVLWNGILVITPFLLAYILIKSWNNAKSIILRDIKLSAGFSFLIYSVFSYYSGITAWVIFIVLSFLPYKWLILLVPGLVAGFFFGWTQLAFEFLTLFALSAFFDLLLSGKGLFVSEKPVLKLKPGDVLAEIIYKGKSYKFNARNFLKFAGKGIIPKSRGLTQKDIDLLKSWGIKKVKVQSSIPFTPIILLGLVVSIFLGDLIWIGVR